jgi:hypothetical protein
MSDTQLLLVAGYSDVEGATAEFRGLADRVGPQGLTSQWAGAVVGHVAGNELSAAIQQHVGPGR